ncbi:MAG: uroporphyrinogen decarboxylase [Alicyclobacillaceae bacterium]|nr:uroporphyrinogen decarboxylase [Alicyclobacillaceae bacterium]
MPDSARFLRACRREPVDQVPVWYMRQAGRYQPEYRKLREQHSLLEICRNPRLCAEVTRLPVEQIGVDAAILFSDITIVFEPMGIRCDIREHVGPVIDNPVRTRADVERLRPLEPAKDLPYVLESVALLRSQLPVPLIGFAGGPFTLASYLVEGGPSRDYVRTKQLMYSDPVTWHRLMDLLADAAARFLAAQVQAGAAAVQVFDSWVGSLAPADFRQAVLPAMQRLFGELQKLSVPLIYFGVATGELLALMGESGATVIGVDWRVPIRTARARIGRPMAIQGNLDPALLFAPWPEIEKRARAILDEGLEEPGFIFNLGHGVIHHQPPVAVSTLQRLTRFVHDYSREQLQSAAKEVPSR